MSDLDYDDVYVISGYEAALKFLVDACVEEFRAGVDPRVVLVRFHSKANNLRRLNEQDRRMSPPKKRVRNDQAKKKKVKA